MYSLDHYFSTLHQLEGEGHLASLLLLLKLLLDQILKILNVEEIIT